MRQVRLGHLRLDIVQLRLLIARIHDIAVLASELIVRHIDARLASLLELRGLERLAVVVHLRRKSRSLELLLLTRATRQIHAAELLGRQIEELLLKLLLPLCKVQLGGQELGSDGGIDFAISVLNRGRGQDLLVGSIHHRLLAELLRQASEAGADGRLGHALAQAIVALASEARRLLRVDVVLGLVVRSRGRRLSRSRRLWGGAQAGKQVGAAGARGRNRVLRDRGDLGRRGEAQALERGALAAGSKAGAGEADAPVVGKVVVSHLSKTASVHADDSSLTGECERVKLMLKVMKHRYNG